MATVLNRATKELIRSANTPDYDSGDWIINPDLSAVTGEPIRYWLIVGDVVSLADAGEQATIDAAILAAQIAAEKAAAESGADTNRLLLGFVELVVDEVNILRLDAGLNPPRTLADYRSGIKTRIQGQT